MKQNKILITGIGSISSIGYENNEVWNKIQNRETGLRLKTNWRNPKIKTNFYGEADTSDFNNQVKWMDRFPPTKYSQLGILACKKAIEDAGIELKECDNELGLIIETSLGATESVEDYLYDLFQGGVEKVSPIKFTKTVANTVLGDISRLFKINGPSSLLYNENSICYGYDLIKKGVADIVICGGVDHYTDFRVLSEQETGQLVTARENQHPFNAIADTSAPNENILGEGACFIVLESERSAKKRNANAYAELVDYKSSFDYQNIESTYFRNDDLLINAFSEMEANIIENSPIAFLSAYTTKVQSEENEQSFLTKNKCNLTTFNHKALTGDMKAASGVMGVGIASQLIQKETKSGFQTPSEPTTFKAAFINTVHEGGGNSYFLLKSIN